LENLSADQLAEKLDVADDMLTWDGVYVIGDEDFMKATSNASTGYSYMVNYDNCPIGVYATAKYVEPVMNEDDQGELGNTGTPGQTLFYFHAWEDAVECTIDVVYARVWEFDWSMINSDELTTVVFDHYTLDIKTEI